MSTRPYSIFKLSRSIVAACWLACGLFSAFNANALIQRGIGNLSFESPVISTTTPCRVYIAESKVPFWQTNHAATPEQQTGGCTNTPLTGANESIFEIWRGPRNIAGNEGLNTELIAARRGAQFSELNATQLSTLSQQVCLINGEDVRWRFSHNGRNTTNDNISMNIGATLITTGSTSTTGQGSVLNCLGGSTCNVNSQVTTSPSGQTRWADYSGNFSHFLPSGNVTMAFNSLNGLSTNGNFLDDIQIDLVPVVEFSSGVFTSPENNGVPPSIGITVVGVIPTGGLPLNMSVNGAASSAIIGTDYQLNGQNNATFTFTIPAGDYSAGAVIQLPVTLLNDTTIESNESFQISILPSSNSSYQVLSTATCGGAATSNATYTIVDDDADVSVIKNQRSGTTGTFQREALTIAQNKPMQYELVMSNLGSLTVNNATFTDAIPANLNNLSVISATTGSGATACSASLSGNTLSGSFSAPTNGTCTVIVQGTTNTAGTVTNTATVAPPTGFNDINTADNSSSVSTTISPATLRLSKISNGGIGTFGFALTNTSQTSSSVTTLSPATATIVDGGSGAGNQDFAVSSINNAITINENSIPANWSLNSASCTNSSGTVVGSLSGSTYTIPAANVTLGQAFSCSFINQKTAQLSLRKIWANARVNESVSINAVGSSVNTTLNATANTSSETDSGSANAVSVDDTVTLSEAFAIPANAANYTATLSCTGNSDTNLADGLTINAADTAIVCTPVNRPPCSCVKHGSALL